VTRHFCCCCRSTAYGVNTIIIVTTQYAVIAYSLVRDASSARLEYLHHDIEHSVPLNDHSHSFTPLGCAGVLSTVLVGCSLIHSASSSSLLIQCWSPLFIWFAAMVPSPISPTPISLSHSCCFYNSYVRNSPIHTNIPDSLLGLVLLLLLWAILPMYYLAQ
jgi:hypothetical protein